MKQNGANIFGVLVSLEPLSAVIDFITWMMFKDKDERLLDGVPNTWREGKEYWLSNAKKLPSMTISKKVEPPKTPTRTKNCQQGEIRPKANRQELKISRNKMNLLYMHWEMVYLISNQLYNKVKFILKKGFKRSQTTSSC